MCCNGKALLNSGLSGCLDESQRSCATICRDMSIIHPLLYTKAFRAPRLRRWAVSQCLKRVAGDYESQRALLEFGVRETGRHCRALEAAAARQPAAGSGAATASAGASGAAGAAAVAGAGASAAAGAMSPAAWDIPQPASRAIAAHDAHDTDAFMGFDVGSPDSADSSPPQAAAALAIASIPGVSTPLPDWAQEATRAKDGAGGRSFGRGLLPAAGVVEPSAPAEEEMDGGAEIDPQAALWFAARRLRLLAASDRLETLMVITRRAYDAESYSQVRLVPSYTCRCSRSCLFLLCVDRYLSVALPWWPVLR